MPTSFEIVSEFCKLVDQDKNYQQAATLLHVQRFQFTSPKENFHGKADWLKGFPEVHKAAPIFEAPKAVDKDTSKVTRKGFKKFGILKVHILETYTVDEASGTILHLHAAIKLL